ncbi:MAG: ChbG/HpnK family deacetylase [Armatimonadetes bacterium]|nr:ChbG/HpnK family deacetylase [Armatimonadota bacterium]
MRMLIILAALACAATMTPQVQRTASAAGSKPTLAERLGYKASDKLLIINGDDTGMCHAANVATMDALDNGLMTSATIMVPCPWFTEIVRYAKANPTRGLGVHLTHTSEWQSYRWGPVLGASQVPGLVDPDGFLWRSVEGVYAHAKVAEAKAEARAQVDRALKAGIDVSHIDSHMGAMQYRADFHKAYLELASELNVPVRMGSPETYERAGFPGIRAEAEKLGLVFPDRLVHEENPEPNEARKDFWLRIVRTLKPGVTELYIHASTDSDEARAVAGSWKERAADYELFTKDKDMRKAIEDGGIIRISYRPLRDLQRKERAAAK